MEESGVKGKEIKRIKVLGVRVGDQMSGLIPFNSTVYCLMMIYRDGSKEVVECGLQEMNGFYVNYIEI